MDIRIHISCFIVFKDEFIRERKENSTDNMESGNLVTQ